MKRLILSIPVVCLALVAFACTPAAPEEGKEPEEPEVELLSPRLTVSGLPSSTVVEGNHFTLSVSTKSDADIKYDCNVAEDLVKIQKLNKTNYRITLGTPGEDTAVTITFRQEATKEYDAAAAEVSFLLKKKAESTVPDPLDPDPSLSGLRIVYEEVAGEILNPERGLYTGAGDIRSASGAVTKSKVESARRSGKTLMYVGFYLTNFMDGDISENYLEMIRQSMSAFREGGVKCILRFAYQNSEGAKPWDPPVDVVLRHIEQVKPILQENEDIIFVMQAGFIGVWGEWYYTQHFNDMSDRRKVVDALLDALPASREIQLRTPAFKMQMYSLAVKDTLTAATAHDGSFISRLGGHNDCFGASSNDSGTFDTNLQREYWKGDSRYTIMGGETCKVSSYCSCDHSLQDVEDYHWTYLNSGYNTSVLNVWKTSGCYDEIVSRLGYRLVLADSYHTENPVAGQTFNLAFRIINRGFAAPQNPRNAILVFVDKDGRKTEFPLDSDPRTWHSGVHTVQCSFTLPAAKGTLYLNLSDPLLPDRPEYSIACANKDVFDAATGYNKLLEL